MLPVSLAVLNPKGRDPFLDYSEPPLEPIAGIHAPINFHAFAAATRGAFFDSTDAVIAHRERFDAVLLLIRKRAWISLEAAQAIKKAGSPLIVSWKECSESQIAKQLRSPQARRAYAQICELADVILTAAPTSPPIPAGMDEAAFDEKLRSVPTPYPIEFPGWDFSRTFQERNGIFIGTREFKTPARNHQRAIEELADLAQKIDVSRITVINTEGKSGLRKLKPLAKRFPEGVFQIIHRPLPYPTYMRLLATHQVVFQRDLGGVPGQVAGDCLLARVLCVGGNSTIEKIAFKPFSAGEENSMNQLGKVLTDAKAYEKAVKQSQSIAESQLSYRAVAHEFAKWRIYG